MAVATTIGSRSEPKAGPVSTSVSDGRGEPGQRDPDGESKEPGQLAQDQERHREPAQQPADARTGEQQRATQQQYVDGCA